MSTVLAERLTGRSAILEALDMEGINPDHFAQTVRKIDDLAAAVDAGEPLKTIDAKLRIYKAECEIILKVAEAPSINQFNFDTIGLEEAKRLVSGEMEAYQKISEEKREILGSAAEFHCDIDALKATIPPKGRLEEVKQYDHPRKGPDEWIDMDQEWVREQKKKLK